ncbi:class II fructose-bisphosphate aldolase [Patescibacteria group bacterium]|nr:class II fructose-bisphosphate aldolase [Patescibacteria group bacterium]
MKQLHQYLKKAQKEKWALAQFNFSTAEQLKGIVQASVEQKSPLLLGTSEGDSSFFGLEQAVAMVAVYRKQTGIPILLSLDHGKSVDSIVAAIEAGYDAVHFDGSHLSFEDNIEQTKEVVALAKQRDISVVEGELGHIPGSSKIHKEASAEEQTMPDPAEVAEFAAKTKVDSIAFPFGSAHGIYAEREKLDLERLQETQKRVQCFIVLHGGSGIDETDMRKAVHIGVVKINVSTALRAAHINTLREILRENLTEVTPYKLLPGVVEAVMNITKEHIQIYGSYNKI